EPGALTARRLAAGTLHLGPPRGRSASDGRSAKSSPAGRKGSRAGAGPIAPELDPHLVPLHVPPPHRREPAEDPAGLRHQPAPPIDEDGPARAGKLVLSLHLGPAEADHLLAGGLAGHDALENIARQDDALVH